MTVLAASKSSSHVACVVSNRVCYEVDRMRLFMGINVFLMPQTSDFFGEFLNQENMLGKL